MQHLKNENTAIMYPCANVTTCQTCDAHAGICNTACRFANPESYPITGWFIPDQYTSKLYDHSERLEDFLEPKYDYEDYTLVAK